MESATAAEAFTISSATASLEESERFERRDKDENALTPGKA
jgi:hypothetical protein